MVRPIRPIGLIRAVWPVRTIRVVTTAVAAIVVPIVAVVAVVTTVVPAVVSAAGVAIVTRTLTTIPNTGRRNDADAAEIAPRHAAPRVVVYRALFLTRDEPLTAGSCGAPILEDVTRLRPVRPNEYDTTTAVVPVRIEPGIIVDVHPEPHAGGVVRIPRRVADVGVAIVA